MTINRNEYYVRPVNGNDSTGDGLSHATAWLTTSHALGTIAIDTTDGDRINVCDEGTETLTAAMPFSTYGGHSSRNAGLTIEGYTATAGDGGLFSFDCGGYGFVSATSQDYIVIQNGKFTNWGYGNLCFYLDDYCSFVNLEFDATIPSGNNSYRCIVAGSVTNIIGCKFHNFYDTSGVCIQCSSSSRIINNHIDTSSHAALRIYNAVLVYGNLILNGRYNGECIELRNGYGSRIINNSLISSASSTAQGIGANDAGLDSSLILIMNNYIEGFIGVGGAGISFNSDYGPNWVTNNYVYNCTDPDDSMGELFTTRNDPTIVVSDPGLMDWANGDWRPTKALIGKSETTEFLPSGTASSLDIGAIQHPRGVIGGPSLQAGRSR